MPSGVRLFAAPWTVESFDSKLNVCSTVSEISLHHVEGETFWLPPITCTVVCNLGEALGESTEVSSGSIMGARWEIEAGGLLGWPLAPARSVALPVLQLGFCARCLKTGFCS